MSRRLALLSGVLVWFVCAAMASAQGPLGDSLAGRNIEADGITIDADSVSYNRSKGTLEAVGDVVISNGETILVADEIEVDRTTSEARARGGVVLEDPGARIRAEKAVLSLREETGVLDDVEIYLPTTRFQMRGAWMAKGFGQTYEIRDGELTSLVQTRQTAAMTGQPVTPYVDNLVLEVDGGTGDVMDLVRGTERGLLVTCLWYIREVDPQSLLLTGLTRDGVYLVEDGEITGLVNNFRWNESPVDLLRRFSHASSTVPSFSREWGDDYFSRTATPALRVPDFNMSSVSQAR